MKDPVSTKEIAVEVMEGFGEAPITAFNTKIYTTKNYADKHNPKKLLNALHNISEHHINSNRTEMKTNDNITLLLTATEYGHLEIVKALIENYANINAAYENGWTALHIAAKNGDIDIVKFLIKQRANIVAADNDARTPLHIAAKNGHLAVVKTLIENGANINAADKNGWTALHRAVLHNHPKMVEYLLTRGARINLKDNDGFTALDIAKGYSYSEIVDVLAKAAELQEKENFLTPSFIKNTMQEEEQKNHNEKKGPKP